MSKEEVEKISLVVFLSDGVRVDITVELDIWEVGCQDSFINAIDSGGLFNEEGWGTLVMKYNGFYLDVLNCKRVVGWMY